jgi:phosphoenolpyruvate carboxykinase (ATP)
MFRFLTNLPIRRFGSSNQNLLKSFGITNPTILRNLSVPEYYECGVNFTPSDPNIPRNAISNTGAFVAYSGAKTGRSPNAKRIVNDPIREKEICWGKVNMPIRQSSFELLDEIARNYLNSRKRLYVVDGYAGWDKSDRVKVRVVCTRSYHALFMTNMLIRPSPQELNEDFSGEVDYYIFNAGEFPANKLIPDVGSETCVALNFASRKFVILGTQYAGEMKKGVFTIMNYLMPKQGHLPMHASCNVGKNGDVCIFFGLSGTGKTALSAVGDRKLIGDDEHVWTDKGVFNIEGGCYAKCVGLTKEKEPEIYNAMKFGTLLENVVLNPATK